MGDHVRRVTVEDWREYRELRLEGLKDSPFAFGEAYDDALRKHDGFWEGRIAASAAGDVAATFVVVRDGRFVGQATCLVEDDGGAQVVGVYVAPAVRGDGVADTVMAAALSWAREVGAGRIRLFVTGHNPRAAAFYRRLGFVPTGFTMPYPPEPGVLEHELVLAG